MPLDHPKTCGERAVRRILSNVEALQEACADLHSRLEADGVDTDAKTLPFLSSVAFQIDRQIGDLQKSEHRKNRVCPACGEPAYCLDCKMCEGCGYSGD